MRLFFKNGIKQLFKTKIQIITYIILLAIATLFVSAFGISAQTLKRDGNNLWNSGNTYDYSFKYTSSEYDANGTASIYPWFTFDNEYLDYQTQDKNGTIIKTSFPVLSIATSETAQDGVLKPFHFINSWKKVSNDYNFPQGDYESTLYQVTNDQNPILGINYQFGDVESQTWKGTFFNNKYDLPSFAPAKDQYVNAYSQEQKYNVVAKGMFGSFYRLNLENINFKQSAMGRLYQKYQFATVAFNKATNEAKKAAQDIFTYMFYLNNSTLTDLIKNEMLLKVQSLIKEKGYSYTDSALAKDMNDWLELNNKNSGIINDVIDPLTTGFHNQIGWVQNVDGKNQFAIYSGVKNNNIDDDFLYQYGGYRVNAFEKDNMFLVNSAEGAIYNYRNQTLNRGDFFTTYYNLIGDLTNFKTTMESQVVMWGIGGEKYRYVSSFSNIANDNGVVDKVTFNNEDNLKIYSKRDDKNSKNGINFLDHAFMVSQGYAKKKKLVFGKEYAIIPSLSNYKIRFDAIAADSLNSYPLIYDEDLLTDSDLQAVFYLNSLDFSHLFNRYRSEGQYSPAFVDSSQFQDTSRVFLKSTKKEKTITEQDFLTYRLFLADNIENIAQVSKNIANLEKLTASDFSKNYATSVVEPRSDTTIINLRSTLLNSTANVFLLISLIFGFIFIVIVLFVVHNIIKRMLANQKTQIGNLKSLGVKNSIICFSFMTYMLLPIIAVVPIFWAMSLLCQFKIMNIFQNYFNIPIGIASGWGFMLLELVATILIIGIAVFVLTYHTVRKSSLHLLSGDSVERPNLFLAKLNSKIHFKKFTSKLRGTIFTTSLKEIFNFSLVFFVSALIMATSIYAPSAITGMKNNYYQNIHYQNGYQYGGQLANMPLTNYGINIFDNSNREFSSLKNSFLNTYIGDEQNKVSFLDDSSLSQIDPSIAGSYFEWILFNNLSAMKGINFTVNDLTQMINNAKKISSDFATTINAEINSLSCTFIPTIFNQTPIELNPEIKNQYVQCITKVANNIVPSTVKADWDKNPENFNLFSINFGNLDYDPNEDEFYTIANIYNNKKSFKVLGIDNEQKNQQLILKNQNNFLDFDENVLKTKVIPVTVNKKAKLLGIKAGDRIKPTIDNNLLAIGLTTINPEWWKYDDNGTIKSIYSDNLDMSHLTYFDSSLLGNNKGQNFYWKDANGNFEPYKKMQNIELIVPYDAIKSDADKTLWESTMLSYQKMKNTNNPEKVDASVIIKKDDLNQQYIIHPFDNRDFENGVPQDPSLLSIGSSSTKANWWNLALSSGLVYQKEEQIQTEYQLKVIGYQNTYNGGNIYMNQKYLNMLLGFPNPNATWNIGGQKINIYSNAKFSNQSTIRDQMEKTIFKFNNGDVSFASFATGPSSAISKADYVAVTKQMVSQLIISVRSLAIIFIFISLVTSFIMIYIITDVVVGKFSKFMSYMRIQGYTSREINSIFIWLFLPCTIMATLLGSGIMYILFYAMIPKILISVGMAVPLIVHWYWLAIIIISGVLIFSVAYIFIIWNSKKIKLGELLSS